VPAVEREPSRLQKSASRKHGTLSPGPNLWTL
jgi:hypothetical protein